MRLAARKAPPLELYAGTVIGGYSIEAIVSRHVGPELVCDATGPNGEPASVVVARQPPADRRGWAEFRRRAAIRVALQHPALLPVYAFGEFAGRPYLATDRYPEVTFADMLGHPELTADDVCELLAPVCEALDLAHEHGLVHQSLSSASLLLDEGGLFLDTFGVAGWPPQPTFESLEQRAPRYASPEELEGAALEPASNIYSMACVMLEALSDQERPSKTRAYVQLMGPSPVPGGEGESSGSAFDRVIAGGVARDAAARPSSASLLLTDAAAALGLSCPAPAPVTLPPRIVPEVPPAEAGPPPRRRRVGPAIAVVLALAALAGAVAAAVLEPFGGGGGESRPARGSDASSVLKRLEDQRGVLRHSLAAAGTPQAQAAIAAQLAAAYGSAARALGSGASAAAARGASAAYSSLAAAAESGDETAITDAGRAVDRAERRVTTVTARH